MKVSILFQGPLSEQEVACIERSVARIRQYERIKDIDRSLKLEILVASWQSFSHVEIKGLDKLILIADLDSFTPTSYKPCNVHRIIELGKEGLLSASNPLVVRLRSDLEIVDVPKLMSICNSVSEKGFYFENKVAAIDYSSVDPMRYEIELPYHVCDWIHIGLRSDLLKIFVVPIPEMEFYSKYVFNKRRKELGNYVEALRSEAYLTSFVIRKSYWSRMETDNHISWFQKLSSNIRVSRDFRIVKLSQMGIRSNKHPTNNFDANRFSPLGYYVWRCQLKDSSPKLLRRAILVLYYKMKVGYLMYYKVKSIIRFLLKKMKFLL